MESVLGAIISIILVSGGMFISYFVGKTLGTRKVTNQTIDKVQGLLKNVVKDSENKFKELEKETEEKKEQITKDLKEKSNEEIIDRFHSAFSNPPPNTGGNAK